MKPNLSISTKQSGVALITAIFIVAIATTAATTIAANYHFDMRRTENMQSNAQALAYAKGAEQWAMAILARDLEDSTHDSLDEDWAVVLPAFPLPGGGIEGNMEDAQGKLNINALLLDNDPNVPNQVDPDMLARFSRLFELLEIDPGLVDRIVDYLDEDIIFFGTNGAEQDIYIGLDNPYRPADQYIKDVSELRLVFGIEAEIYEKILPHVTALPRQATLNLNSASAYVLASLEQNIDLALAQQLIEDREENPYLKLSDFLNHSLLTQGSFNIKSNGLNVQSEYFTLITRAYIANSEVEMISLIHRKSGNDLNIVKRTKIF